MKMKVKHRLPSGWPSKADDRRSVSPKPLNCPAGKFTGRCGTGCEVLWVGCDRVIVVITRDHKAVPACRRVDVHERNRPLILTDNRRGQIASQDPAEKTVAVGHRCWILPCGSQHAAGVLECLCRR
jgi:hypothetical protein